MHPIIAAMRSTLTPRRSAVRPRAQGGLAILLVLALLAGMLVAPAPARAQAVPDSCGLVVNIVAAPYAAVDSNKPGIDGPKTVTLGAKIVNTSGLPIHDVRVAFASPTLTLLNGNTAGYVVHELAPGESTAAYWPVTYPATFGVTYAYAISATAPNGCQASGSSTLTTQSQISASANKLLPSGSSLTVSPAVVPLGGLVTVRITGFTLGVIGQGYRNGYDAWLQPVGNRDFDPTCLRLVRSEVLLHSISATPFVDQLYFTNLRAYRSDLRDYVAYTFIALRNCTTVAQPYQKAASGTQEKYNDDFSALTSRIAVTTGTTSTLKVTITPDRSTVSAGDTVHYTVQYVAPDGTVGYPDNGNPVVVYTPIPAHTEYVPGTATETAASDAEYSTDGGGNWTDAEPVDPGLVTDLRWRLSDSVGATPGEITYAVVVEPDYAGQPLLASASGGLLDGEPLAASTTTVTKAVANNSPAANDDDVRTNTNTKVTVAATANDTDVDGNLVATTAVTLTMPAHGTLTNLGTGSFTYTPNTGYVGPDSFDYRVCDAAAACDTATVVVYVGQEKLRWTTYNTVAAYEDLKNVGWSDWDYNDFVVDIQIRTGLDPANQLAAVEIGYDALARGAGYSQRFLHTLPIEGGGIASLSVYDGGALVRQRTVDFDTNTTFPIFERTHDALPPPADFFDTNTRSVQPAVVDGRTAKLTVYLKSPAANPSVALPPPPWDPFIYVYYTQQEVHLLVPGHMNNTQLVNPARDPASPLVGYDLPLAQTFPSGWKWPEEFRGIWRGYPDYVDYVGSGGTLGRDWWLAANSVPAWLWKPPVQTAGMVAVEPAPAAASRYFGGPVAADLDGDGWNEVVVGNLLADRVEVTNAGGWSVAGWPQPVSGGVKAAVKVADLDGDGSLEILAGTESGMLYAWRHDGRLLPGWPVTLRAGFRVLATPAVGDLDGDGRPDVIVPVSDGKLYAVDPAGSPLPGWPVSLGDVEDLYGGQVINSSPVFADVDGDGAGEIVVGSTDNRVYVFAHTGALRWSYPTGDMVISTPAVGPIDPTIPGQEIVVGSGDRYVYLLDADGNLVWRRPTGWIVRSSPVLADLDGDQNLEILVGSDDDKVWAWHRDGSLVAGWPQATGADVLSSPRVGDVDGDGQVDVVVGADDAKVYAWHADGSPLAGWPQPANLSVKGAPLLANVDDDPLPEVMAADLSGVVHRWNVGPSSFRALLHLPALYSRPK